MRVIDIPFCGFYHSSLDMAIDSAIEIECFNRIEDGSNEGDESSYPEMLRLDSCDIAGVLYDPEIIDFTAMRIDLAKNYLDQFNSLCEDHLGESLSFTFESVESPREYNFATDRLFAFIPDSTIQKLWNINAADKFESLAEAIEDRHTSHSGFASSYPNDLDSWLAKPLAEYDHNELETLLIGALESYGMWRGYSSKLSTTQAIQDEAESDVIESFNGNGEFDSHVNWEKFNLGLAKLRVAKLEKLDDHTAAGILESLAISYDEGFLTLINILDSDYRARLMTTLEWWKPILQNIVEAAPCEPTGAKQEEAA